MEDWTRNEKVFQLSALTTAIKKDPTTHMNWKSTRKLLIKQDFSLELNLLDYAIWGGGIKLGEVTSLGEGKLWIQTC